MRILLQLIRIIMDHLETYSRTIPNYRWSFGNLLVLCSVMQITSWVLLWAFYIPDVDLAFVSDEEIQYVLGGWLIRYFQINGAGLLLILLYPHARRLVWVRQHVTSVSELRAWYAVVIISSLYLAVVYTTYFFLIQNNFFGLGIIFLTWFCIWFHYW